MSDRKPRISTAIRFPTHMHEALRAAADERDVSMNFLVVHAVREFLPRLLPVEDMLMTKPEVSNHE